MVECSDMPSNPSEFPAPLSEFDRALRAIVTLPKTAVVNAETKSKRKPVASKRKEK